MDTQDTNSGILASVATNNSGQGKSAAVPTEIKGWNWGAFGFNWIWGVGNDTYIALLCFIPLVGIVMMFVLGARGNEWAWQNRHWDSIERFKKVQRTWTKVWLIFLALGILWIVFWLFLVISIFSANSNLGS